MLLHLKCELAAQRFQRTLSRYIAQIKFNPGQLRIPAGQPEGGQWTNGENAGDVIRVGARGRTFVAVRVGNRALAATPGQAGRLAYANARAQQTLEQVREVDPTWRPTPSLSDPNSVEGAIRTAEAEAVEAQARLGEILRPRSNGGPPLDPIAGGNTGLTAPLPPVCIANYRNITGMPDIGDRLAFSRAEGTVAFANVDGKPVFGVNSDAPGYTVADGAAARVMRDRLVTVYPDVMNTDGISWKPNDVVYHAEANALMRAAEPLGGSLAGRTIDIGVDRGLCPSCDTALPYIGLQLGSPTVRITDTTGARWVMQDGVWIQRGRR
jgi:hypothetical protein